MDLGVWGVLATPVQATLSAVFFTLSDGLKVCFRELWKSYM